MASSGMLHRVALVGTDVSEELGASFIRVVPSSPILVTLMMMGLSSSETSVLTRATWHNIPKDAILQKPRFSMRECEGVSLFVVHKCENHKCLIKCLYCSEMYTFRMQTALMVIIVFYKFSGRN
jgi:hypothetical protein